MPAGTLQSTGVDFVCIPTADHERAVDLYGETLGLERVKQWGTGPEPNSRRAI